MWLDDFDEIRLCHAGSLELSPCGENGRLEHDGGGGAEIFDVAKRRHVGFCAPERSSARIISTSGLTSTHAGIPLAPSLAA